MMLKDLNNKGEMMKITEWFVRAVAAGLMSDDENISGRIVFTEGKRTIILFNESKEIYRVEELWNSSNTIVGNDVQLRSNGKDLYSLEWRKANDWESYKFFKVWYKQGAEIVLTTFTFEMLKEKCYCLLADHGQIAPTEADFKRIYGE